MIPGWETEILGLSRWLSGKKSAFFEGRDLKQVKSLGWEDPLEKEMATHSSTLAWEITLTEESGRLQSVYGVAKSWTRLSN